MTSETVGLDYMLAHAERLEKESYGEENACNYDLELVNAKEELTEATARRVSEFAAGHVAGLLSAASEVEKSEDRNQLYNQAMNYIRHVDQDNEGWTVLEEEN